MAFVIWWYAWPSFSFFPMGSAVTVLRILCEGVIRAERVSLCGEVDIGVVKTMTDTLG